MLLRRHRHRQSADTGRRDCSCVSLPECSSHPESMPCHRWKWQCSGRKSLKHKPVCSLAGKNPITGTAPGTVVEVHAHLQDLDIAWLDPHPQAVGTEVHAVGGLVLGQDPRVSWSDLHSTLRVQSRLRSRKAHPIVTMYCPARAAKHQAGQQVPSLPGRSCAGRSTFRDASPGGGWPPTGGGTAGPSRRRRMAPPSPSGPAGGTEYLNRH